MHTHYHKYIHTNHLRIYLWHIQLEEKESEKATIIGCTLNMYQYVITHIQLQEEEREKKEKKQPYI